MLLHVCQGRAVATGLAVACAAGLVVRWSLHVLHHVQGHRRAQPQAAGPHEATGFITPELGNSQRFNFPFPGPPGLATGTDAHKLAEKSGRYLEYVHDS